MIAAALVAARPAAASDSQTPVDRSDPTVVIEEDRQLESPQPTPSERPDLSADEGSGATADLPAFVAGAIRVEGSEALAPADFAAAIEPYLGRLLEAEDLRALARDVADTARHAGYGFATAWIPSQSISAGILRVHVDEGRIDDIAAEGPAGPAVERVLEPLAGAAPVRTRDLERRLLLAGDLAGVSVRRARLLRLDHGNVLRIDTVLDRVRSRTSTDNWGTDAIGPLRTRLSVDLQGLVRLGDRLTIGGLFTPVERREFQFVQGGYVVPLGTGSEATLRGYLSRSNAGGALRERGLEGDAAQFEAGFSHALVRSRARSLWGHLFFGVRDSELVREGIRARDDRIVTMTGIAFGAARIGGGTTRLRLSLTQGLDALGATERGEALASRADAGGPFTKLEAWTEFVRRLGGGFSVLVGGEGQWASRPLLASEEMGLGGRAFLRGYDYREFSGDRGIAASAELRFDLPDELVTVRRFQLYAYADAGRVTNLRDGFGGGSLASAGGGVRLGLNRQIDTSFELGIPLADGAAGERPNPRLSFVISTSF